MILGNKILQGINVSGDTGFVKVGTQVRDDFSFTLDVPYPSSPTEGNLIVAFIFSDNVSIVPSTPTNWTNIGSNVNYVNIGASIFTIVSEEKYESSLGLLD